MKGKGKLTRRTVVDPSPKLTSKKIDVPSLNIKFNITHDNLSCFMGTKNTIKKGCRRVSRSIRTNKKPQSKLKHQVGGERPQTKQKNQQRKIETSPDISRELSNTILSHIQNKGVKYAWTENQEKQQRDESFEPDSERLWTVFSNQFEKSYASTNDFPYYQTMSFCQYDNLRIKSKSSYDSNVYSVLLDNIGNDPRTTIMIRNIPNKYTIDDLSREIDIQHSNTYDFLYLPCDLKNQCNVGYGFINFTTTQNLKSFYYKFQSYVWKKFKSEKICALTYARLQGLTQLIEHFQNSKVFKDKKYRPIIKYDKIHQVVLAQQSKQTLNF